MRYEAPESGSGPGSRGTIPGAKRVEFMYDRLPMSVDIDRSERTFGSIPQCGGKKALRVSAYATDNPCSGRDAAAGASA